MLGVKQSTHKTYISGYDKFVKFLIENQVMEIDLRIIWLSLSDLQKHGLAPASIRVCKWSIAKVLNLALVIKFNHVLFKDLDGGTVNLRVLKVLPCKWSVSKVFNSNVLIFI